MPRRLFRATPYVLFGTMVLAAAIIPSSATDLLFAHAADAIALIGLFATARVFMALAAMDIGTAFGTLGARREMMIGFLAEPALLMVMFNAFLLYGSTALPSLVDGYAAHPDFHRPQCDLCGHRILNGPARRKCPHSHRQPGHPPGAHHGP